MTAMTGGTPLTVDVGFRGIRWLAPIVGRDDPDDSPDGFLGSQAHHAGTVVASDTDATQHHGFQIQLVHGNLRRSIKGR